MTNGRDTTILDVGSLLTAVIRPGIPLWKTIQQVRNLGMRRSKIGVRGTAPGVRGTEIGIQATAIEAGTPGGGKSKIGIRNGTGDITTSGTPGAPGTNRAPTPGTHSVTR